MIVGGNDTRQRFIFRGYDVESLFNLIEQLLQSLSSETYALIGTITLGFIYVAKMRRKEVKNV